MKFVPDAKDAWRWFSVQLAFVSSIAPAVGLAVPEDIRAAVPQEWMAGFAVAMGALIALGRLVDQK